MPCSCARTPFAQTQLGYVSGNHNKQKRMNTEIRLEVEELEERIAPSIVLTNPGGNEPQSGSAANGQANNYDNPAGFAPPGHNK